MGKADSKDDEKSEKPKLYRIEIFEMSILTDSLEAEERNGYKMVDILKREHWGQKDHFTVLLKGNHND